MFKALTPIFAILISVGLVVTHIQPSFMDIRAMERETDEYKNALEQAAALQALIDQKLEQRRSFDQSDLVRLAQMVPTEVDEVGTLLTLDGLARKHTMMISNISVLPSEPNGEGASADIPPEDEPIDPSDPAFVGAVVEDGQMPSHTDISFTVSGTYDQFKDFMLDLERSLELAEVQTLEFSTEQGDVITFDLKLRFFSYNATE